jgi:hypothetical protein
MGHRAWRIQGLFLNHYLPGLDSKVFLVLVVTLLFLQPFFLFVLGANCTLLAVVIIVRHRAILKKFTSKSTSFNFYYL